MTPSDERIESYEASMEACVQINVLWQWLREQACKHDYDRRAYCSNQIGLSTMRYWRLYQKARRG